MPQYTLRGVEVRFPFDAYPCQLEYMGRVIEALQQGQNALLESPTGTGKTLCLLCATLAWRESLIHKAEARVGEVQRQQHTSQLVQGLREAYAELNAEKVRSGQGGLPVIIYSSRTHSQLQQVMKELRNSGYRQAWPNNALLSSRQQTCLNPSVSSLTGVAANRACRALVAGRACKWHLNVERFVKRSPEALQEVLDIEDIVRFGQSRVLCPYYLGREMAKEGDILFMPYNYLLDSKFRTGLGINWEQAVIIFDEAHNVEARATLCLLGCAAMSPLGSAGMARGVCSDSASFDLPAPVLAGCIVEVGTAAELAVARADGPDNVVNEFGVQEKGATSYAAVAQQLRQLQMVLQRLEAEVAALKVDPEKGLTRPGAFIFELLGKINLTVETYLLMASLIETALDLLTGAAVDAGRSSGSRSSNYRLHALDEALRLAFASAPDPMLQQQGIPPAHLGYRVHVHLEKARDGRMLPTLSYWCFSPGQTMAQLAQMKVGSIILTSGTLSPLDSFAQELALPFPVRLENPHVIDPSQVWIGVVPLGPSGHALNSSYQTRDSKSYKEDLGNAIANFARIVPDGLLVFFPSYGLLKASLDAWKAVNSHGNCVWERITKLKACVVEPRDSALFPQAADDFRAKLNDPATRGAIFFAVCRGKVSEGLDFSDRAGRAVVITGIPYATKTDPKVCIKQELLDEQRRLGHKRQHGGGAAGAACSALSGSQWYSQQAMRAVNQAMGRVIRHRRDYGAIILCDERFKGEGIRKQLSKWLRDSAVVHPNFGSAAASLTQFFKKQGENARLGLVSDGGQAPVRNAAGPQWGAGAAGPFSNAIDRKDSGRGAHAPRALPAVPLAMDVVGLTDLLGCAAANGSAGCSQEEQPPASRDGGPRLMTALAGRPGAGGGTAQQAQHRSDVDDLLSALAASAQEGQQAQQHHKAPSQQLKPWEKAGLPTVALLRPASSRPPVPLRAPSVQPASNAPTMVGPAHLVQRHQQQLAERAQHPAQEWQQAEQPEGGALLPAAEQGQQAAARVPQPPPQQQQQQQRRCSSSPAGEAGAHGVASGSAARTVKIESSTRAGGPAASDGSSDGTQHSGQPPNPGGGSGASGTGNAPAGQQKSHQELIKLYLRQLKEQLPLEGYQAVLAALKRYRKDGDRESLMAAVVETLQPPERAHLLPGLARFLPKDVQAAFAERVGPLVRAAAAHKEPLQPSLPPAAANEPQTAASRDSFSRQAATNITGPASTAAAGPSVAITAHHARQQAVAVGQQRSCGGNVPPQRQQQQQQQNGQRLLQPHAQHKQQQQHGQGSRPAPVMQHQALQSRQGLLPCHPQQAQQLGMARHGQAAAQLFGKPGQGLHQQQQQQVGQQLRQQQQEVQRLQQAHVKLAGSTLGNPMQHDSLVAGGSMHPRQQLGGSGGAGRQQLQQQGSAPGNAPPARAATTVGSSLPRKVTGANAVAVAGLRAAAAAAGPAASLLTHTGLQRGSKGSSVAGGNAVPAPASTAGGLPITTVAECAACGKAPMEAPHQAVCGHQACYPCWLKAIALMKCAHPACKKHVRKSQLSKMYFQ
ncbi:hypothetical protein N2152v2_002069 [Parachlorella kessleri]